MRLKLFISILFLSFIFFSRAGAYQDIGSIQKNWLNWTNAERQRLGIKELVPNKDLNGTALSWSEYSRNRGFIDHKRAGQKAFYDYKRIAGWFSSKGVTFKKVRSVTFSESIGWNTYSCNTEDCTSRISDAVYKTFAMYMREKGKRYRPHYNSMTNPAFSQIGIGIALDETKRKYYITVHYGTEVIVR